MASKRKLWLSYSVSGGSAHLRITRTEYDPNTGESYPSPYSREEDTALYHIFLHHQIKKIKIWIEEFLEKFKKIEFEGFYQSSGARYYVVFWVTGEDWEDAYDYWNIKRDHRWLSPILRSRPNTRYKKIDIEEKYERLKKQYEEIKEDDKKKILKKMQKQMKECEEKLSLCYAEDDYTKYYDMEFIDIADTFLELKEILDAENKNIY